MASEETTVTFELQSGEIFSDIRLENLEQTLAEFVDHNLKTLEVCTRTVGLAIDNIDSSLYYLWSSL